MFYETYWEWTSPKFMWLQSVRESFCVFPDPGWVEIKLANRGELQVITSVTGAHCLDAVKESCQDLQGTRHALRNDRTHQDGEIGGTAIGYICSREALLIIVSVAPFPAKEGGSPMDDHTVLRSGTSYFDSCFSIDLFSRGMEILLEVSGTVAGGCESQDARMASVPASAACS